MKLRGHYAYYGVSDIRFVVNSNIIIEMEDTLVRKSIVTEGRSPEKEAAASVLEEVLRAGASQMLQAAIENEMTEYLKHCLAVRNGSLPAREITTGIGPIAMRQPRVDDRKLRERGHGAFTSRILPRYLRRVPSIDNLIPVLCLKGISTGDFSEALSAILGPGAAGLSATNIVRLKADYQEWSQRDLSDKEYVYFWADGIYSNVRLDDDRMCILVIIGADEEGNKELAAVGDGYRESTTSWKELLLDLRRQGLKNALRLATADDGLGFWAALGKVFPRCREQRCWVHKTANILDKLPKSMQSKAKSHIHDMYHAESYESSLEAYDHFVRVYKDKYPKAVACLEKDKEVLFTFYDFPAVHWIHIRSTNPIESTFATVRHRTKRTKGRGSRTATLTMVFGGPEDLEEAQRVCHDSPGIGKQSVHQRRIAGSGMIT